MAYSPRVVANALLLTAKQRGESLTHLKLQKLIFFVHAWSLALRNKPAVNEAPEAWPYGPVWTSLYHELKTFGSEPITTYLTEVDMDSGEVRALVPNTEDSEFWATVGKVWERYGDLSAGQLSTLSHESGGPWEATRRRGGGLIDADAIAEFYRRKTRPVPEDAY